MVSALRRRIDRGSRGFDGFADGFAWIHTFKGWSGRDENMHLKSIPYSDTLPISERIPSFSINKPVGNERDVTAQLQSNGRMR